MIFSKPKKTGKIRISHNKRSGFFKKTKVPITIYQSRKLKLSSRETFVRVNMAFAKKGLKRFYASKLFMPASVAFFALVILGVVVFHNVKNAKADLAYF